MCAFSCWPRQAGIASSGREGWLHLPAFTSAKRADPIHTARALAFVLSKSLCQPVPIYGLCQSTENYQNYMRDPVRIHYPGPASSPCRHPSRQTTRLVRESLPIRQARVAIPKMHSTTEKKKKKPPPPPHAHLNLEINIISPLLIANTGHSLNETICICYLIRSRFSNGGKIIHWDTSLSSEAVSCLSVLYPVECYKRASCHSLSLASEPIKSSIKEKC